MIKKEKDDSLYIVMPAYNESENIENVIDEWYPIVEKIGKDSRLVIIDDGSKDNTYKIIKNSTKNKKQLIALTKGNSGHGSTVLYGYNHALLNKADYIFQTDSDGQTNPEEFWEFWKQRKNYAMIIGYRNKREDGLSRIIVTKTLKLVIRFCFKVNVTDANTPFRLMSNLSLKECIELIPKDFNLSNVILSVIYEKKKLPVKYIPITFKKRQGGVNSININKITKIGFKAIKDFKKINKELNDCRSDYVNENKR